MRLLAAFSIDSGFGVPVLAYQSYAPILVLILVIMGIVGLIMALTHVLGPKRHGPRKDAPYEAGMPTIGDARGHFSARFYIVALLFLLFDVEVVFLWPWAVVFHGACDSEGGTSAVCGEVLDPTFLLVSMAVFVALLVVGFLYEAGKGVFRWM